MCGPVNPEYNGDYNKCFGISDEAVRQRCANMRTTAIDPRCLPDPRYYAEDGSWEGYYKNKRAAEAEAVPAQRGPCQCPGCQTVRASLAGGSCDARKLT